MGDSEEQKVAEKVKAINLEPAAAKDGDCTEEEEKKSDDFKILGNEAFKGKHTIFILFIPQTKLSTITARIFTRSQAKPLSTKSYSVFMCNSKEVLGSM